jgi:hypothetical protein
MSLSDFILTAIFTASGILAGWSLGCPKLREHLGAVVAYMTMSKHHRDFVEKLDRFLPRFGEQYLLPFDCEPENDDGKGL